MGILPNGLNLHTLKIIINLLQMLIENDKICNIICKALENYYEQTENSFVK